MYGTAIDRSGPRPLTRPGWPAQISAALSMSLAMVKTHLGRVFDQLQVDNRVQVALRVRRVSRR